MKNVGIIAEFNPFHNGHKYLIDAIREDINPEGIVCVMSGDFVQRGYPAVTDKWVRAKAAVAEGADLVIELPTVYALSSAKGFASGAVSILEGLGCISDIAFGSETGELDRLKKISEIDIENNEIIKSELKSGASYASALSKALGGDISLEPNDILGVEYLRANTKMTAHAIKRKGRGHIATASYIRENMAEIESFVPEDALYEMQASVFWDELADQKLFDMIRYALIMKPAYELQGITGVTEGLENALKKAVVGANSVHDIIMNAKSKRYTYSKISRVLMCIALDMGKDLAGEARGGCKYARVLAMNETGARILKEAKNFGNIQIISNLKKAEVIVSPYKDLIETDIQASDLYSILTGRNVREFSDFSRNPML